MSSLQRPLLFLQKHAANLHVNASKSQHAISDRLMCLLEY